MRRNRARLRGSAMRGSAQSMNAPCTSCDGTAVPMALMKAVGREESPGLFGFGEAGAKMDERREKFHRLCGEPGARTP